MSLLKSFLFFLALFSIIYFAIYYQRYFIYSVGALSPLFIYMLIEIRYSLMLLPFYIIAKIQGKNFKELKTLKEIKAALQLSDKGIGLETLFATPAWEPIISLESCNSPIWEEIRDNFFKLKPLLPPYELLSKIATEEANNLVKKGKIIDSPQISKSTVKVFLKWLFSEDCGVLTKIDDNLCERLFLASVEYRKEIAIKAEGCKEIKREAVTLVTALMKQSRYKDLWNWDKPINYSVIMQPFVISPMINMSDIGVNIEKYYSEKNNFPDFSEFVEHCIYIEHPFPLLERYDEKTNTHYYINTSNLKDNKNFDGKLLNFGMGIRACLGRVFAKEFLNSFFQIVTSKGNYQPRKGHLYSGRDNDKIDLSETVYQIKVLIRVIWGEFKRNYLQ